jgi:hypothetical protein
MKDHVNVRGAGARRCIIRGDGTSPVNTFWPDAPTCGSYPPGGKEYLVDFQTSGFDTYPEQIDGFTFLGGDVQVGVRGEGDVYGIVSNCIFDMRHGELPGWGVVNGPYIGVFSYQIWLGENNIRYHKNRFQVLDDTFVMGDADGPVARDEAVAIVDVNDPRCGSPNHDPVSTLRGINPLSVQNNLIRSLPTQTNVVMLGVGADDTEVVVGTTSNPLGRTNAFRSSRVGPPSNPQSTLWSATASVPAPAVDLDADDPGFVGEVLAATSLPLPTGYRDYRLMPDSRLVDRGAVPGLLGGATMLRSRSLTTYLEPGCEDISVFRWDGESYGNPRVVGGLVDIGMDETHFIVMAGDWSNQDASHHLPPTLLNPNVTTSGQGIRLVLLPASQSGATLRVDAAPGRPVLTIPGGQLPGWTRQPGTIAPTVIGGLPTDLDTLYIALSAPGLVTWTTLVAGLTATNPVTAQVHAFGLALDVATGLPIDDTETAPSGGIFFNVQGSVRDASGNVLAWSNLQSEYR